MINLKGVSDGGGREEWEWGGRGVQSPLKKRKNSPRSREGSPTSRPKKSLRWEDLERDNTGETHRAEELTRADPPPKHQEEDREMAYKVGKWVQNSV